MTRLVLVALVATPAAAADPVLSVPPGFTVTKVAGPPLVERPVAVAFDDKGRLYVTESSGSNEPAKVQLEKKPHRVLRLEDTNGDGTFDKRTVFADKMMFPQGIMWLNGSVYVGAPPHIWKLTDTDDDGVADKREVWFDGKTLTGCLNDLHGPYPGPDGYIYWTKGAFAKQEYTLPNGKKFETRAAHVFRAKPDGTGIEPVFTAGMDNPVDVAFAPSGDMFVSGTFFQHPADGKRDGLIHAVYGGVWGKDHDVIRDPAHKWTSPKLMEPMTHLGPAAPCGLHRYESDQFGPAYRDNLFCCQFNLRTVSRHVLKPHGSTYRTEDSKFVWSDDVDFHPTDVIEDANGSLIVVDTGGWYKLCCPSSQLVKTDVFGGIYRVRKTGAHKVDDPWGKKINWVKLGSNLGVVLAESNPHIVARCVYEIGQRTKQDPEFAGLCIAIAMIPNPGEQSASATALRNAVWLAARDYSPKTREWLRLSLRPSAGDASPQLAAIRAVGLLRDKSDETLDELRFCLSNSDPHVRRAAAEALGRIGDASALPELIVAIRDSAGDRVLDHSLTYALIQIGDAKAIAPELMHPSPRVRRAALVAMHANGPPADLADFVIRVSITDADPGLRDTAWWIASQHPEWGEKLTGHFRKRLAAKQTVGEQFELTKRLGQFAANPAIRDLIADLAMRSELAGVAFRAMAATAGLKTVPEPWVKALTAGLKASPEVVKEAASAARALPLSHNEELVAALLAVSRGTQPDAVRLTALAAVPPGSPADDTLFDYLSSRLADDTTRTAAADVLSKFALTAGQFTKLAAKLSGVGPVERGRLIEAFAKSKDETVGRALIVALNTPAVRPSLRVETLKPVFAKYPDAVKAESEKLYAELEKARAGERDRLETIFKELPPGDVRRGQVVFNSTKAACVTCHKIGYVGGPLGPDLTRVGGIRTEKDLLESIVYPSSSFVRSYEPVKVTTKSGVVHQGVLKSDGPDVVVLAVAADKDVRIVRDDVEEVTAGSVSVMPAGLETQITRQELADLIAFLKASK